MCCSCVWDACVRGAMCPRRAWTACDSPDPPWLARPPPCTLTTMSGASARPAMRRPRRQRPHPATPPGRPGGPWWTGSAARSTRSRTRRHPAAARRPPQLLLRRPPPAPRLPPWAPTHRSLRCTSQPSATSQSQVLSATRNSPGATRLMHLAPSSTSIQLDLPTTIYPLRGNVNLRCLSGQRVAASTSRTLMVAATRASHSLAGTTHTELHAVTSPYPTSVAKSAGRQSPRHPASPTTRMGYETTRQNRCPAHPTRLQVPCPVSNIILLMHVYLRLPPTQSSRFLTSGRSIAVCNLWNLSVPRD